MPSILAKEEEFGLTPGARVGRYIASDFGGSVKQKGGEVLAMLVLAPEMEVVPLPNRKSPAG